MSDYSGAHADVYSGKITDVYFLFGFAVYLERTGDLKLELLLANLHDGYYNLAFFKQCRLARAILLHPQFDKQLRRARSRFGGVFAEPDDDDCDIFLAFVDMACEHDFLEEWIIELKRAGPLNFTARRFRFMFAEIARNPSSNWRWWSGVQKFLKIVQEQTLWCIELYQFLEEYHTPANNLLSPTDYLIRLHYSGRLDMNTDETFGLDNFLCGLEPGRSELPTIYILRPSCHSLRWLYNRDIQIALLFALWIVTGGSYKEFDQWVMASDDCSEICSFVWRELELRTFVFLTLSDTTITRECRNDTITQKISSTCASRPRRDHADDASSFSHYNADDAIFDLLHAIDLQKTYCRFMRRHLRAVAMFMIDIGGLAFDKINITFELLRFTHPMIAAVLTRGEIIGTLKRIANSMERVRAARIADDAATHAKRARV